MSLHHFLRITGTAALSLLIVGCASQNSSVTDDGGDASSEDVTEEDIVTVDLSPDEETVDVESDGDGEAQLVLTADGLVYDIVVENLTGPVTAAHFHQGIEGESGPIVAPITFQGNQAQGVWSGLTTAQLQALANGEIYINVHTQQYPDGEIRGQVDIEIEE